MYNLIFLTEKKGGKSDKQMMSFILPSYYTIDNALLPLDPEVTLRRIPERYCYSIHFHRLYALLINYLFSTSKIDDDFFFWYSFAK